MPKTYLTAVEMMNISTRDVEEENYNKNLEIFIDKVFEDIHAAALSGKRSCSKVYNLYAIDFNNAFRMFRDARTQITRLGYTVRLDYADIRNNVSIEW